MALKRANTPGRRPSLAMVARLAGCSLMTASYALRGHPKISAPTRRRVQSAARRLNYVPDPEIARLMHLVRVGRPRAHQCNLAVLSFAQVDNPAPAPYIAALSEGVRARAQRLGYSADFVKVNPRTFTPSRLTAMLEARGVKGIIVPPLPYVLDCGRLLDWSRFSVVAATYSAQGLPVHAVVPNHFKNILLALEKLRGHGLRRVGLVVHAGLHERLRSAHSAAVALYQASGHFADIPAYEYPNRAPFEGWLRRHKPDAVLTTYPVAVRYPIFQKLHAAGTLVVLIDHCRDNEFAGIDQNAFDVGEAAVDLLAGQIQRGELGPPRRPRVMMIEGDWVEPRPSEGANPPPARVREAPASPPD